MENKEILEKLKKLIRLQESAEKIGSLAEAENAALRVQDLLLKYNLSLSDINTKEEKEDIGEETYSGINDLTKGKESDWVLHLFNVIARHNLCEMFSRTSRGPHEAGKCNRDAILVGSPTNVMIVKYTVETLVPRIRDAGKEAARKGKNEIPNPKAFMRAFLLGATRGIAAKLKEQVEAMKAHENNSGPITALVRTNQVQLKTYIDENFGRIKLRGKQTPKDGGGYNKGFETGKNMSINKGVSGSNGVPVLGRNPKLLN